MFFRTLVHAGVGLAVLALMVETWLVSGVVAPVFVASGSMAPALRGPHRLWTCADCKREFCCGLESLPAAGHSAVCPHCSAANSPEAGVDRPGDRVLVDRSALAWRSPRRWEAVVFQSPDLPDALAVKRVVGLPGERVEIRDGEVIVDGRLARKPLAIEHALAVLVHDAADTIDDAANTVSRWRDASGHWRRVGADFVHPATVAPRNTVEHEIVAPIDWLVYHHPALNRPPGEPSDGPIQDDSPYYQAESRLLNPVRDFLLRCDIVCQGAGQIHLRALSGGDAFHIAIDLLGGDGALARNDRVVARFDTANLPLGRAVPLEWMLADAQVQLAIGERLLVDYRFEPAGTDVSTPADVAIGAQGAEVTLRSLKLWRDVYYTPGPAGNRPGEYQLGPDEYFLLGDHSAHSQDSRWWPQGGVAGRAIVGRALGW